MKPLIRTLAFALCAVLVPGVAHAQPATQTVVLAGGCFWGIQGVFEHVRGVVDTTAGFSGGAASTAHYDDVSEGDTGHAESVKIVYDPHTISFRQLLDIYFLVAHDPTELNRQGPDSGTQYRSEIFYTTASQRAAALAYIASLSQKHTYSGPIVTKMAPLVGFYPAEAYHQHYLDHNPYDPYILFNDKPKVAALKARFPQLYNT